VSHEATVAERLRLTYPSDRWALVRHVRSALGERGRSEGVRIADVIAVGLYDGDVDFIEIKCSAGDLRRETPEKSAPFLQYASRRWIAARSPWKNVVPSKSLLPNGFGLLSVGTGRPEVIVSAEEHEPPEKLSVFARALLRAAVANTGESAAGDAPLVEVIRPFLSRGHVGLGCHHAAMSLAKTTPDKLPCLGCRDGHPTDPEAIEAAIADASPEQLARYAALCAGRRVA
jgi:hypothetical protein